ncbi:MAG: transglutaminase family protein [Methylacidiphilales bacterium]|nr:transglutaminase family protein [Candidatus Methylacidiphilales bacterium]
MIFNIVHTTAYEYSAPAIESFTELRVRPRQSNRQNVYSHVTEVEPRAALEEFTDYYGNTVECLSVPFRHRCLTVTSRSTVETLPHKDALSGLDLTVSEAVRLNWPHRRELFDFLMPSMHAPITPELETLSKQQLPSSGSFSESMLGLCTFIFKNFTYMPGVTDVRTPLTELLQRRAGVCQDFAHLMIALIRCAGLPARYVSGYIETESSGTPNLVGATASHAWVEVYLPNGLWVGIDPTNNILEGERHVQIGIGRDYHDVSPLRGVFKGAERQYLSVGVTVSRTTGEMVSGVNKG